MRISEAGDKFSEKEFLILPLKIYKGDPNWIRPLDKDINAVFDKEKNKSFRHGKLKRWILYDNDTCIGRVAAFINTRTSSKFKQPTGGMGFFECINNQEAANLLFDTCKKWLMEEGMEAMDGPINFGERDKWWGCLVEGFTEPNYTSNYNPPYYKDLFENYGFQLYYKQFTFSRPVVGSLPESVAKKTERIARDPDYTFKHIEVSNLEKYTDDFLEVYNKAWGKHVGVAQLRRAQAIAIFKQLKPLIDPDIVWYAYYKNEPVGFFLMLPEVNQIFKYVNGKMNLLGKLKFLYFKRKGVCRKMFGVSFGITPEHQGKGLEGAIINKAAEHIQPMGKYDVFEMNWIGDFNPVMIKLCESVGSHIAKTHITYRMIFNPAIPFERAPIIQ